MCRRRSLVSAGSMTPVDNWRQPAEKLDGLALVESTPGPLILVLQFVGFLGGWRDSGTLAPWQGGVRALSAALATITAAVTGVMLNLALWLAVEVVAPLRPEGVRGADPLALAIAVLAWWGMRRWRWPVTAVLSGAAVVGLLRLLLPGAS